MAEGNDETEFPGSDTASRIIETITRPFRKLLGEPAGEVEWDESDEYNFSNKKRGIMVVFNNEYFKRHSSRPGSSIDAASIKETFTNLKFDVAVHHNKRREEMLKILKNISKQDHSDADCFACFVLSHGDEVFVVDKRVPDRREKEDLVYATDEIILTRELVEMFTDKRCPSLTGKPRLFFIQACRGNRLDSGVEVNVSENVADARGAREKYEVIPCPIYKDFLIMYATPPGHYAFRRADSGSWFVNGLCDVLSLKSTKKKSLTKILTDVIRVVGQHYVSKSAENKAISDKKQSPCFSSMLVKDVYFK